MGDVTQAKNTGKSSAKEIRKRLKKIRIIGGPEITPPPDTDFQQVPFTVLGLSEIEDLHLADTVIVWPSISILDRKAFSDQLAFCGYALNHGSRSPHIFGLPCSYASWELNDLELEKAARGGYTTYGPVKKMTVHEKLPAKDCTMSFRFDTDDNDPKPMAKDCSTLQKRIAFACSHHESVKNNDWSGYSDTINNSSLESDICNLVISALGLAILAAHNGAAVALIYPYETQPINREDCSPEMVWYVIIARHFWLSSDLNASLLENDSITVQYKKMKECSEHFSKTTALWSHIQGHPEISFCVTRNAKDGTESDRTVGVLRDTEFFFSRTRIQRAFSAGDERDEAPKNSDDVMVHFSPSRIDSEGHAHNMVIQYGLGGFVAMGEPPSLEALLDIKTNENPFVRIELTNRRILIKGQTGKGYIVEVDLSSGMKRDVPMTVSTFRRFLAFCVAAKLASGNGQSGTVDLTEMKIGKCDLSDVVDPVPQGQGHKPGQLIEEAFKDVLKTKFRFFKPSPDGVKDARRLHPDYWGSVKFDKLMKQVKKPHKADTENEAALRKIFSVLK